MSTSSWFVVFAMAMCVGCAAEPGGGGGGGDDDDGPGPGAPDGGSVPSVCESGGLGAWTGHDNVLPSTDPPCGLAPTDVPMFVAIGFDDNGDAAGMTWAIEMLAARNAHASFYMTSVYGQSDAVKATWKAAYMAGHEVGNHTINHSNGASFSESMWTTEMQGCTDFLVAGVIPETEMYGFRTPFLAYNDAMLTAAADHGFWYDCSIEEGYEYDQDGTNYYWPYTLDNKSPGHTTQVEWGEGKQEISAHPGLWEMPVYAVIVPPELRDTMKSRQSWFDAESGKITGFDYNLWALKSAGGFEMTKAEFVATLKYTLDQRLAGNRAPFLFGAHAAYYVDSWNQNAPGAPTAAERQAAVEEFLDYAKSKGATITSVKAVLDWVRNPT